MTIKLKTVISNWWKQLKTREKLVLTVGGFFAGLLIFFMFIFSPWKAAIDHMAKELVTKRSELSWMRRQSRVMDKISDPSSTSFIGQNQSLMSVIQQTASQQKLQKSIKQITPRPENNSVSVLMEEVSFNGWARWVTDLEKRYGVSVVQLSAERDEKKLDIADIRVQFKR